MPIRKNPQNFPFFRIYFAFKTVIGSTNLRGYWSSKGRCKLSYFQRSFEAGSYGPFQRTWHALLSTRMKKARPQNGCLLWRMFVLSWWNKTGFLWHIDGLCGSLVPFSESQELSHTQPKKAIGKSMAQAKVTCTSAINWGREPEQETCSRW